MLGISNGMRLKPLLITLLELPSQKDCKLESSATSDTPIQFHNGSETVTMSATSTKTKPSNVTLISPSAEKDREFTTSTTTQCITAIKSVIMSEASTATRSKSPSIDLFCTPAQEDLEVKTSAASDIPTQYGTSNKNRPKFLPVPLFDPSTQENCESKDSQTVILCDSPFENDPNITNTSSAIHSDSSDVSSSGGSESSSSGKSETSSIDSFDARPESPPMALFDPSAQEGRKCKSGSTSGTSTQYDSDSDVQTVILWDSPSEDENDTSTLQTSGFSHETTITASNTFSDDSSDDSSSGGSNSSSSGKSETSSIDSFDTRPESPPMALFDPSTQEDCEFKISITPDMLTQYDSNSDIQTVILSDSPSEHDPNELHTSKTSQEEPNIASNTSSDSSSDDFSDDSSVGSSSEASDTSSSAKSESSSIDSFDTSSQHDSESEDEEPPKGSQSLAAYASPLWNGQRIRTSCDSIHDPGGWHVDPDGFINEKDRAGGPFLCSLPETILDLKGNSPLMTVLETISLYKMIVSVLEEYKVNASSIKIKRCQYELYPIIQPLATLIITATRETFSDDWVQACREIWRRLSENGLGHINVEISDPALHKPFYFWAVDSKHPYYSKHMEVMEKVRTELKLNVSDFVELAAFRVGTTSNVKDSEVFMHLTVDFKSDRDWRGPRDLIVSILDEFKLPMVGVMIQKGKKWGSRWGCESAK
ncbi:hypothetical protein PEX2_053910 [Penicillium expansum]|uniref:Uncharacterized protein n=1 Tax=Penicillium expansum TaxID=27334 RepID=A0A0A2JYU4_PENEN|nr:hypothetical protein PEX2_053910 [Penicillium expansum]KGO59813.1 hypothetical protein PEX2_053910 [Penicillium expansum]